MNLEDKYLVILSSMLSLLSGKSLSLFRLNDVSEKLIDICHYSATLILFQNIVPISLVITVELVKTIQAFFIYQDIDMYYEPVRALPSPSLDTSDR